MLKQRCDEGFTGRNIVLTTHTGNVYAGFYIDGFRDLDQSAIFAGTTQTLNPKPLNPPTPKP